MTIIEALEQRVQLLHEEEGKLWAELHAVQGRRAEALYWLEFYKNTLTESQLEEMLPDGWKVLGIDAEPSTPDSGD